jgi:hypothetical protein
MFLGFRHAPRLNLYRQPSKYPFGRLQAQSMSAANARAAAGSREVARLAYDSPAVLPVTAAAILGSGEKVRGPDHVARFV